MSRKRNVQSVFVAAGAATEAAAEGPEGLDHWAAQGPEPRHTRGRPRGAGELHDIRRSVRVRELSQEVRMRSSHEAQPAR